MVFECAYPAFLRWTQHARPHCYLCYARACSNLISREYETIPLNSKGMGHIPGASSEGPPQS